MGIVGPAMPLGGGAEDVSPLQRLGEEAGL